MATKEHLPYLLADDSEEFVQLADLVLHIPVAEQEAPERQQAEPPQAQHRTDALPLHSQVLSRCCSAVAGMLASLASPSSGAACSPRQPLDVTPFFQGTSRAATLLFLSCAYSQAAAEQQLEAATADGGPEGLDALTGMLRLAHRLDAPRLLRWALGWAHGRRERLYGADPTAWLLLAEELHLDELRAQVAEWLVAVLRSGPATATAVLQRLDLGVLRQDTAAMLLDGLASTSAGGRAPTAAELQHWCSRGSLCQVAAARAAAAQADARQAAQDALFAAELAAQQEQAEEDWGAEFDEAEAAANEWGADVLAGDEEEGEEEEAALHAAWQDVVEQLHIDDEQEAQEAAGEDLWAAPDELAEPWGGQDQEGQLPAWQEGEQEEGQAAPAPAAGSGG